MARYVWRNGQFVDRLDKTTPMEQPERDGLCMPQVIRDIPEYRSPVGDHKLITSRSARREDLARHGCVEVEPRKRPRGYANPRWAAKKGLPVSEEAIERRAQWRAARTLPTED